MGSLPIILEYFRNYFCFFGWRDCVEILFLTSVIYTISLWLSHDTRNNLLGYFYGYAALVTIAYNTQLTSILYVLTLGAPYALFALVLIHQKTLQRNFVTLRNRLALQITHTNWCEILIRACMNALNNNKEITCIIEHTDNLTLYVTSSLKLSADIDQELLSILIASKSYIPSHMLWITTTGKIIGMNAHWRTNPDPVWLDTKVQTMAQWKQNAVYYTTKTDAIVLRGDPNKRLFTLIVDGTPIEQVNAHNVTALLLKYIKTRQITKHGGITNAHRTNARQKSHIQNSG